MDASANFMDITANNIVGKCNNKCELTMKYTSTDSVSVTNNAVMLSIAYDAETTQPYPVLFNSQKYAVVSANIVSPSLHTFNGQQLGAELIVEHAPMNGGGNLFVCIPCIASGDSSLASSIITSLISAATTGAIESGESTSVNITGFSFKLLFPKKPFFVYTNGADTYVWAPKSEPRHRDAWNEPFTPDELAGFGRLATVDPAVTVSVGLTPGADATVDDVVAKLAPALERGCRGITICFDDLPVLDSAQRHRDIANGVRARTGVHTWQIGRAHV